MIKRTTTSFYSEINKIADIDLSAATKTTGINVLSASEECNLKPRQAEQLRGQTQQLPDEIASTLKHKPRRSGSFYRSCGSVNRIRLLQVAAIATLA
ncbi:MAG TPA: hypothetical protein DF774_16390 [Rheinheimera sp.]|nr:hypothetical protein [Rheinheimera sp.]